MLIPASLHEGIRNGEITLAFRSWKRPTVKTGGTLQTPAGLLRIDALEQLTTAEITDDDARAAGAASRKDIIAQLRKGDDRTLYRIRFHRIGDDPRIALRQTADIDVAERDEITARLDRWDTASRNGPWTREVLRAINRYPGMQSGELAGRLSADRQQLKRRIRRLKSLGLTQSLQAGYRLSPRGRSYLDGSR